MYIYIIYVENGNTYINNIYMFHFYLGDKIAKLNKKSSS